MMYESYGKYSDYKLVEALEWKRHFKRTVINHDIHRQSVWYLDKEILCLETLLCQRIKQRAIDEASKKYIKEVEEDEMITDELEIEEDGDDNNHPQPFDLPTQPLLVLLPQFFSPSHHIFCNNANTTLPPDIVVPIPFPPSPMFYYPNLVFIFTQPHNCTFRTLSHPHPYP